MSQIWLTVKGWHAINKQYLVYNYFEYSEKKKIVYTKYLIINVKVSNIHKNKLKKIGNYKVLISLCLGKYLILT